MGSAQCPRRVKEVNLNKSRVEEGLSNAETTKSREEVEQIKMPALKTLEHSSSWL